MHMSLIETKGVVIGPPQRKRSHRPLYGHKSLHNALYGHRHDVRIYAEPGREAHRSRRSLLDHISVILRKQMKRALEAFAALFLVTLQHAYRREGVLFLDAITGVLIVGVFVFRVVTTEKNVIIAKIHL